MRKTVNSLVGLVFGAIIGAAIMWASIDTTPTTVYVPVPSRDVACASEDSCSVDYGSDKAWHIGPDGSGL